MNPFTAPDPIRRFIRNASRPRPHRGFGMAFSLALGAGGFEAAASISASYRLEPSVMDGGGGQSASANYKLLGEMDDMGGAVATSASYTVRSGFPGSATGLGRVVGRWLFYNAAAWDGGSAAADARDDQAIATDKSALLPGIKASFGNYSSYSRGINGVMVDLEEPAGSPTLADFVFRVGNTDTHTAWTAGPAPTVHVRPGAGIGGSTRVTLIWADRAIQRQWLRVDVLGTDRTDLGDMDRFFFGNAIGETGNRAGLDAIVNATDEILARLNPRSAFSPAPIGNPHDFNRDKQVNATDQITARLNTTSSFTALRLITPTVSAPALASLAGAAFAPVPADAGDPVRGPRLAAAEGLDDSGLTGDAADPETPDAGGSTSTTLELGLEADGRIWIVARGGVPEGLSLETINALHGGNWVPVPDTARLASDDGLRAWIVDPAGDGPVAFFRLAAAHGTTPARQP